MTSAPAIIIHGGTGLWDENRDAALRALRAAAGLGWKLLGETRPALDVVEQTARLLEDDPLLDAGRGSHLNTAGEVELDAILMDGRTLASGAVAAIRGVANPIGVARLVMTETKHALLVGGHAQDFARQHGIEIVPEETLITPAEYARWQAWLRDPSAGDGDHDGGGTVGVVVRDVHGDIAAATSTGGTKNKLPGRVGDSPIIGCGAYADNLLGGASSTGLGEALMKIVMAKTVCDLMGEGMDAQSAAEQAVKRLDDPRVKGWGGVIALDPQGRVGFAFNSKRMARAYSRPDGTLVAEI